MGPIAEDKDIIFHMETHEHNGCRVPDFEGYTKIYVWNEETKSGKGHGGVITQVFSLEVIKEGMARGNHKPIF